MKKVGVYSNSSLAATGFGKHARILLQWLTKNGYDAFEMAAGYTADNPKLKGLPWRAYGLTKDEKHLNSQDGVRQLNGYGAFGLDEVIKKEKPDFIIAIEDSWAWHGLLGRAIYRKNPENWLFWSPQDSLPILDAQLEFAREVKNYAVKAPFAQKAFADQGIDTKFLGALSDFQKFYPDRESGRELRRKSGIDDSTLTFGFVFRNQLRKLVTPLIEGFKLFKDKNPNQKAKLIFHTDPKENWDIPRIIKLSGLSPEDVFFTTICPACKDVYFGPALENTKICKCGRGELHHPKPDYGISEEELNKVYNSFDAYIHPVNSGGAEFPLAESLHCGLISATVDYSYGEMYIQGGPSYSLPFTWYEEVQSSYKKARPTAEGICEFMQFISSLTDSERIAWQEDGRKWAVDFFETDKICRQVAEIIDAAPETDYNWNFPCLEPEMSKAEDEDEFIKENHYSFFGEMGMSADDYNFLKQNLKNGAPREWVYQQSQNIVRGQLNPIKPSSFFKDTGRKRLLVGMERSIGDCLILLNVLDQLHEKYKDWDIYVLTEPQNQQIFEHLDYLAGFVPPWQSLNTYLYEGSAEYEKLVDIYLQPFKATQGGFGWTHNGYLL